MVPPQKRRQEWRLNLGSVCDPGVDPEDQELGDKVDPPRVLFSLAMTQQEGPLGP